MEKVVHIRYVPKGNIFQMIAPFKVILGDIEINEEVVIECSGFQKIGSLLEKTKEKIMNSIRDKFEGTVNELKIENSDVEIQLRRKRQEGYKIIPEKLTLSLIMSQDHEKTRMAIFDQEFRVVVNSPTICNFLLPPVLYASFSVGPVRFDGLNIKNTLCKFNWYRSKDKIVWEKVDGIYFYAVKLEDVGYFLKMTCIPVSREHVEGPCVEIISKGVVLECPEIPQCPFELRHAYTKDTLSGHSYRVVSYNSLSSRYTYYNDTFSYCQDEFLAIDYRKRLILKEILGYNAEIICLQEIDQLEYHRFFKQELETKGYSTKFYRKGFYLTEGMMCAVRKSRFKLKSYEQIVFCNALKRRKIYKELYNVMKKDDTLMKKFAIQSPSLLIMSLKCKERRKILVGNIHMSHHELNDDIRLIHSYMAIRCLKFMKEILVNANFKVNIILCGDFNSLPNSPVYDFICNGELKPQDYLKVSGRLLNFQHNLRLKSACGIPKYTTYTPTFKECIDYIFIEEEMSEFEQIVPFLEEEVERYSGLPNQFYPSDHLASVVDVKFEECE